MPNMLLLEKLHEIIVGRLMSLLVWMIRLTLWMASLEFSCAAIAAALAELHTKLFDHGVNLMLRFIYGGIRRFWWDKFTWERPMSSTLVIFAKVSAWAFTPALFLICGDTYVLGCVIGLAFAQESSLLCLLAKVKQSLHELVVRVNLASVAHSSTVQLYGNLAEHWVNRQVVWIYCVRVKVRLVRFNYHGEHMQPRVVKLKIQVIWPLYRKFNGRTWLYIGQRSIFQIELIFNNVFLHDQAE